MPSLSLVRRDFFDNDDCIEYDLANDRCIRYERPSFVYYIVAAVIVFLIFLSVLACLCLSRRKRNRQGTAYYGTRWLFPSSSPPQIPPRPGFQQQYNMPHYPPQQSGYYAPPPPGQEQWAYSNPTPMSPAHTGTTHTGYAAPLRGGEDLPPPPKYTPGNYGQSTPTHNTGFTESVRETGEGSAGAQTRGTTKG